MKHTSDQTMGATSVAPVGTLARGLQILEYLLVHEGSTQSDLVRVLGLPKATVHRLVTVLVDSAFVVEHCNKELYLGPLFMLARGRSELAIIELLHPLLTALADATSEGANLAILAKNEAIYIDAVHGSHLVGIFTKPSNRVPLHATGVGKALLASLTQEELQSTMDDVRLTVFTKNTISTTEALFKDLEQTADTGLSFDLQEYARGVNCVATWIRIGRHRLAVSISGPSQRVDKIELIRLSKILKQQVTTFCNHTSGVSSPWTIATAPRVHETL